MCDEMKTKFKSGDLVENKNSGKIEMVNFIYDGFLTGYFKAVGCNLLSPTFIGHYRLLHPKKVKFNLK